MVRQSWCAYEGKAGVEGGVGGKCMRITEDQYPLCVKHSTIKDDTEHKNGQRI